MKIYNSYTELMAAQSDFVPMNGERRESARIDNGVAEAVAAAKTMDDFNDMYLGAIDTAKAAKCGGCGCYGVCLCHRYS